MASDISAFAAEIIRDLRRTVSQQNEELKKLREMTRRPKGCICDWSKRAHDFEADPDCDYHKLAAMRPYDHSIPWNCPTYYDGCNCKDAWRSLDPEGKKAASAEAEDLKAQRATLGHIHEYEQWNDELLEAGNRLVTELGFFLDPDSPMRHAIEDWKKARDG